MCHRALTDDIIKYTSNETINWSVFLGEKLFTIKREYQILFKR